MNPYRNAKGEYCRKEEATCAVVNGREVPIEEYTNVWNKAKRALDADEERELETLKAECSQYEEKADDLRGKIDAYNKKISEETDKNKIFKYEQKIADFRYSIKQYEELADYDAVARKTERKYEKQRALAEHMKNNGWQQGDKGFVKQLDDNLYMQTSGLNGSVSFSNNKEIVDGDGAVFCKTGKVMNIKGLPFIVGKSVVVSPTAPIFGIRRGSSCMNIQFTDTSTSKRLMVAGKLERKGLISKMAGAGFEIDIDKPSVISDDQCMMPIVRKFDNTPGILYIPFSGQAQIKMSNV